MGNYIAGNLGGWINKSEMSRRKKECGSRSAHEAYDRCRVLTPQGAGRLVDTHYDIGRRHKKKIIVTKIRMLTHP